jgi:hypothetical protein
MLLLCTTENLNTLVAIAFLTLYDGINEEIVSSVDGPISTGVQPKALNPGRYMDIRKLHYCIKYLLALN